LTEVIVVEWLCASLTEVIVVECLCASLTGVIVVEWLCASLTEVIVVEWLCASLTEVIVVEWLCASLTAKFQFTKKDLSDYNVRVHYREHICRVRRTHYSTNRSHSYGIKLYKSPMRQNLYKN
jgi:uncharacterized membrane protein YdbT with pleckstrin-like domain